MIREADEQWPIKVRLDDDTIMKLERLRDHVLHPGGLIVLPTETVYGLAANALCDDSVFKIFEVKGRPLSDPVILHVPTFRDALSSIFDADLFDACLILFLGLSFSPGPLTMITRGKEGLSPLLSANTGFPAVRCPSHHIAQLILKHVGVPLAAPSANKFGHISPTSAEHVSSEFEGVPMFIIDGGRCDLGVESTVLKVEPVFDDIRAEVFLKKHKGTYANLQTVISLLRPEVISDPSKKDELIEKCSFMAGMPSSLPRDLIDTLLSMKDTSRTVTILRPGYVTEADLTRRLSSSFFSNVKVVHKQIFAKAHEHCECPGTTLTHYAPAVPTYLASEVQSEGGVPVDSESIVMVDCDGDFKDFVDSFLYYIPMAKGDQSLAYNLYDSLRQAERMALRCIGTVNPYAGEDAWPMSTIIVVNYKEQPTELNATLRDRLIRASSGNTVKYKLDPDNVEFFMVGLGFQSVKKTHVFSAEAVKLKEVLKSRKKIGKSKSSRDKSTTKPTKAHGNTSDDEPSRLDLILSASRPRKAVLKKAVSKGRRKT
ncbi:Threonylcarbamoyl-AMP synthase [Babesia sp. Xinjiang]|uniref:Threonylcarbamoyl-AMP synthase n=1 Tax=Babesia sp. Xinjiang TaxID=462227 RepID=UPI000A22F473|nr:Threonylcarbamoyl-AMP synthase [Babesia sp. Xinjiang]ORM41288.1 Threonylcarbamoyl-AMP synthase [Babesia sp. Xinjiang]